jgi:energy-coupling factor transporter ATP-binding protein EcfA2
MDRPDQQLIIALCGRQGAGKSSLAIELAQTLSARAQPSQPPVRRTVARERHSSSSPVQRKSPQRLTRFIRSTWFALLEHALRYARVLRARKRAGFKAHVLPAPEHAASSLQCPLWLVLDPVGEDGIFEIAQKHKPDVVLFISRMDESRAAKEDRLEMLNVSTAFGVNVWERTIFVFTHGQSLPPGDLTYIDYMRGRRDSIWRSLTSIIPPVLRPSTMADAPEMSPENVVIPSDIPLGATDRQVRRRVNGPGAADIQFTIPGSELQFVTADQRQLNHLASNVPNGEICMDNDQVEECSDFYDDPLPPEIAVVELSDLCPRNAMGMKLLPDGTPWVPELRTLIQRIGAASKRRAFSELSGVVYQDPAKQDRVVGLFRRGLFVLAVEILSIFIVIRSVQAWESYAEEREKRHRREHGDLICAMDEEEFRKITAVDDEPDSRFDKDYEDADEYFFGAGESTDDTEADDARDDSSEELPTNENE